MHRGGHHPAAAAAAAPGPSPAAAAAVVKRPFYIVNEMNGHVLEIHQGLGRPGNHIVAGVRRPGKAEFQLWYHDPQGIIHSMVLDFVLDCKEVGNKVFVQHKTPGDRNQMWYLEGHHIGNRDHPNKCIQIHRGDNRDGADVVLHHYDKSPYQHWRFDFL